MKAQAAALFAKLPEVGRVFAAEDGEGVVSAGEAHPIQKTPELLLVRNGKVQAVKGLSGLFRQPEQILRFFKGSGCSDLIIGMVV